MTVPTEYDDIVVGAGSTGAVIAARLSEDAGRRVLLVEAGADHASEGSVPPELLDTHAPVVQGHNWNISAYVREQSALETLYDAGNAFLAAGAASRFAMARTAVQSAWRGGSVLTRFDYPVGRVTGGSSAVNGALAMRGMPEDYDEWARAGNPAWSWPAVLEQFRALESDRDMKGPYSGTAGPVPIQRAKFDALHPVQRDFFDACRSMGFAVGDANNPNTTGVTVVPRNVSDDKRISTATAYLAKARGRANFALLANTVADRVLLQGNRAIGIEAVVNKKTQRFSAQRVILSAGAIHTPVILMRSGIGPADALRRSGVAPLIDLPGVGQNLIDHPAVGMWLIPRPGVCRRGEDIHQVMLRYASERGERNDMQLYMLNSVDTAQFPELHTALGAPLGMSVSVVLGKPHSRGRVELASRDVSDSPRVFLNCASDAADMRRLMEGVRLAWGMIQSDPLKRSIARVFAWNQRIIESDKLLEEAISTFVRGSWHAAGTARMGPSGDDMAVVDQYGSVHGCERLTVADASIMPTIPRAPTNLTCIMIGEMLAQHLKRTSH